jgi:2-hydroxychromene-2-carboxylate isomerase
MGSGADGMSGTGAKLEFWYEFASTYSYLSAMRIEALATAAGVTVDWKPFLLGPVFHAQGWHTSPFNLYPAKGRHMVRDIERIAAERGLRFVLPGTFPRNSLQASRVALVGGAENWLAPFTRPCRPGSHSAQLRA